MGGSLFHCSAVSTGQSGTLSPWR